MFYKPQECFAYIVKAKMTIILKKVVGRDFQKLCTFSHFFQSAIIIFHCSIRLDEIEELNYTAWYLYTEKNNDACVNIRAQLKDALFNFSFYRNEF